jgi:hypothetical protein
MTTSLSNHRPSARPVDCFDEDPFDEDTPDEVRLRGLTHHTAELAWRSPGSAPAGT